MPYRSNKELPPRVKSALPGSAQTVFRKAVNNALKEYPTESTAFKVAWSAVKKAGFKKRKTGKWSGS